MSQRTKEINRWIGIRDVKLKEKKLKESINSFSKDLDGFTIRLMDKLNPFSVSFQDFVKIYPSIQNASKAYNREEYDGLISTTKDFVLTVESTIKAAMDLIGELQKWPPVNKNLNKAKNDFIGAINDFIKEALAGIKILNEFLDKSE